MVSNILFFIDRWEKEILEILICIKKKSYCIYFEKKKLKKLIFKACEIKKTRLMVINLNFIFIIFINLSFIENLRKNDPD
jgi:hypothetical protein